MKTCIPPGGNSRFLSLSKRQGFFYSNGRFYTTDAKKKWDLNARKYKVLANTIPFNPEWMQRR
jgi:hypothetical protein